MLSSIKKRLDLLTNPLEPNTERRKPDHYFFTSEQIKHKKINGYPQAYQRVQSILRKNNDQPIKKTQSQSASSYQSTSHTIIENLD